MTQEQKFINGFISGTIQPPEDCVCQIISLEWSLKTMSRTREVRKIATYIKRINQWSLEKEYETVENILCWKIVENYK